MGFNIDNIYTILHKHETDSLNFTNPKRDWDGFCLITNGKGSAKNNKTGEKCQVMQGDMLMFRKGENYTLQFQKNCHYIVSAFELTEDDNSLSHLPFHITCEDWQIEKIFKIHDIWQKRLLYFDTICRIELLKLYLNILEKSNSNSPKYSKAVRKAIEFIHSNYRNNFTFGELSQYCSLSPSYLRSIFLKETGTTPIEYRTELRLNMAIEMLESGHFNISEIARDLGFCDIYHFSKCFKKHKGVSPKNYLIQ